MRKPQHPIPLKMPIKIDNFSVTSVIQSFGGVARLSAKLERSGHPISPGGIEKWRERNSIPGRILVKLAQIAEDEGWHTPAGYLVQSGSHKGRCR